MRPIEEKDIGHVYCVLCYARNKTNVQTTKYECVEARKVRGAIQWVDFWLNNCPPEDSKHKEEFDKLVDEMSLGDKWEVFIVKKAFGKMLLKNEENSNVSEDVTDNSNEESE